MRRNLPIEGDMGCMAGEDQSSTRLVVEINGKGDAHRL